MPNRYAEKIVARKRPLLLLVLVVAAVTAAAVYYGYTRNEAAKRPSSTAPAKYRMRIEGLRYYGLYHGKKALALSAESFVVRKKKVGFLTFSIAHEALLENAAIDLYPALREAAGGRASAGTSLSPDPPSMPSFPALFAEETFAGFPVPVHSIGAVTAAPIRVRFFSGERLMSTITAASASLDFGERSVHFQGDVRVEAGQSALRTEALIFLPEEGRLRTDRPYALLRGGTRTTGSGLATDIQLR